MEAVNLDLGWVNSIRVNRPAVERRVQTLLTRRTFKKASQAKAYLHAIACLDLTTLRGDDTEDRIDRLCAKALQPLRPEILEAVCQKFFAKGESAYGGKFPEIDLTVGAVCVYPELVKEAVEAVKGKIPVASVATGFPAGKTFWHIKWPEVKECVRVGASEIDIVIDRELALTGEWEELHHQVKIICNSCREWGEEYRREIKVKTILEVSDLQDLEIIAKASAVAMMAGSDFIKTSTGYGDYGATLEAGLVMVRQIREFYERTGKKVGFKAAGGIKTAKDAMNWLILMKEELGDDWVYPELFRIGASSVLTDIEMQLEHLAKDVYSAAHRQPMS